MLKRVLLLMVLVFTQMWSGGASATAYSSPPAPGSEIEAPAVALGQAGLSFRYDRTYGVTNVPYIADFEHLNSPHSVATDQSGNVYVTEQHGNRVLKFNSAGVFQFGIGTAGVMGDADDMFHKPLKTAVDSSGRIFVADTQTHRIKIYDQTGAFVGQLGQTWVAGTDNAHFSTPKGVALDATGNLYVADTYNHRIQIFDTNLDYVATLGVPGEYGIDNAHFIEPEGIAVDSAGRILVADMGNQRIQVFDAARVFLATLGETGVIGDDNDHFNFPNTVVVDGADNLYIADYVNHRIQRFTSSLVYSDTLGVTGEMGSDNDHFSYPTGVAIDRTTGNIVIADAGNHRVQVFSGGFVYQESLGTPGVPYLTDTAHLFQPSSVAVAADGSLYVIETLGHRLLKLNASGSTIWTIGTAGQPGFGTESTYFADPQDVAVDPSGRVYVADKSNHRVQIYSAAGTFVATLGSFGSGAGQFDMPSGVFVDTAGKIYVADSNNARVQIFNADRSFFGQIGVTGASGSAPGSLNGPNDIVVDSTGRIYVSEEHNHRVQVFSSNLTHERMLSGAAGCSSQQFDVFCGPRQLAIDSADRLYIADNANNRVQVFDATGAYLTTIGGAFGTRSSELRVATGVAVDPAGNVYVADVNNHRIQRFALGVPGWIQRNINGFGDRRNIGVTALEAFNGQLYAGVTSWEAGGTIWRSPNGTTWEQVSEPGVGAGNALTTTVILDLAVFNGQLFAASGWSGRTGQLWVSADGASWSEVPLPAFSGIDDINLMTLTSHGNALYMGVCGYNSAEIWRSTGTNHLSWTEVVNEGLGDFANACVTGFASFNGALYATVENATAGMRIWRSANGDAGTWQQVNVDGFGSSNNTVSGSLIVFNGQLYAGTKNTATGGQIWRTSNGTDWAAAVGNGFGDSLNQRITGFTQSNGQLYAYAENATNGFEAWSSSDGTTWQQRGAGGLGDSNNAEINRSNAVTVFNGSLFVGTWNPNGNGGELWQKVNDLYLPFVRK